MCAPRVSGREGNAVAEVALVYMTSPAAVSMTARKRVKATRRAAVSMTLRKRVKGRARLTVLRSPLRNTDMTFLTATNKFFADERKKRRPLHARRFF